MLEPRSDWRSDLYRKLVLVIEGGVGIRGDGPNLDQIPHLEPWSGVFGARWSLVELVPDGLHLSSILFEGFFALLERKIQRQTVIFRSQISPHLGDKWGKVNTNGTREQGASWATEKLVLSGTKCKKISSLGSWPSTILPALLPLLWRWWWGVIGSIDGALPFRLLLLVDPLERLAEDVPKRFDWLWMRI